MVLLPMEVDEKLQRAAEPRRAAHIWLRYFQGVTTKYTALVLAFV
jgi:hypothetical protein